MDSVDREERISAMKDELQSIQEKETWELSERPPGVKVLRNRPTHVGRVKESQYNKSYRADWNRVVRIFKYLKEGITSESRNVPKNF